MTLSILGRSPKGTEELLHEIKNEKKHLPWSTVKLVFIDMLAIILSGASGCAYLLYLGGWIRAGTFVATLAVFFMVSFLGTLFGTSFRHRALVIILESAAFLAFFYDMRLALLGLAFASMVFFSLWGERQSRGEMINMLKFRFLRAARVKMAKMFTGILLGAMILFLPQWQEANAFISQERFERYYEGTASRINYVYSKLDFTSSAGELARNIARNSLERQAGWASISADRQNAAVNAAAEELILSASRNTGVPIDANMTVGQVIYKYLARLLLGWRDKFGDSFLALWAITVFVIARGLGAVFIWITLYASYFFYRALIAWGFADMAMEQQTREKPKLR